jgi:signal recognition particle GTPase
MATTLRSFVNDLDKIVQQQHMNMALKLAKGQCGTLENYHRQVGQMEGLGITVNLARDMLGQMENIDDGGLPEMTQ